MKTLVVSIKTSSEVLGDFEKALKKARSGRLKKPHYEISFDNRKDFERFIRHISILSMILALKPKSIYELAKLSHMDISNMNKIILFFEEVGALKLKTAKVNGRTVKQPVVEYQKIEFDLAA
jgi:predicted transcriptional regulator